MAEAVKGQWANKIIGHGEEAPDQLLASAKNWRVHPKSQQDALAGVIGDIGFIRSVTVNQRSGTVVDGHLRVAMAISSGQKMIPVEYVDLSDEEESEALAVLDPISALAVADKEQLDKLLREVQSGDSAVQAMLGKLAADSGLYKFDPNAEWQGMPEFEQEDKLGIHITVHFETLADKGDFGRLIGQPLTDKTRSIWYPESERENLKAYHAT
jgi:hypothetical protein